MGSNPTLSEASHCFFSRGVVSMKHLSTIIKRFNLAVCFLVSYLVISLYEIISILGVRDFHEISNYSLICAVTIFLLLLWWFIGFGKEHFLWFHLLVSWLLILIIATCYYYFLLAWEGTILGIFNSLYIRPPAQDPFTGVFLMFLGFVSWGVTLWVKRHVFGLLALITFIAWVYVYWALFSLPCFFLTLLFIWFIGNNYYYYRIYDPFFVTRYRRRLVWREKKLWFFWQLLSFGKKALHKKAILFETLVFTQAFHKEQKIARRQQIRQLFLGTREEIIYIPEELYHFWYHFAEETEFDVIFAPVPENEINKRPLFDREYWGFGKKGEMEEDEPPTSVF